MRYISIASPNSEWLGQWWFQILEPLHLPSLTACYISSIEKARQIGRWHVWRGWWRGLQCQSWSGSTCHMAGSETSWPNKSHRKPQISHRGLEDLIQGQIIASDLIMIKMIIMIIATWRSWHKVHCRWRSQQKTNRGANEPYDPRPSGESWIMIMIKIMLPMMVVMLMKIMAATMIRITTHPDHIVDRLAVWKAPVKVDQPRVVSQDWHCIVLQRKSKYCCCTPQSKYFPFSPGGCSWTGSPHLSQRCWQQSQSCWMHRTQPDQHDNHLTQRSLLTSSHGQI